MPSPFQRICCKLSEQVIGEMTIKKIAISSFSREPDRFQYLFYGFKFPDKQVPILLIIVNVARICMSSSVSDCIIRHLYLTEFIIQFLVDCLL